MLLRNGFIAPKKIAPQWRTKGWSYRLFKLQAKRETPPAYATLYFGAVETIHTNELSFVIEAADNVRNTLPEEIILMVVGAAKFDIGLMEEGLVMMRKSVSTKPSIDNIKTLASRLDDKNQSEIISLCDHLLQLEPHSLCALVTKGRLMASRQNWTEAEKLFELAVKNSPKNGDAWFGLGSVHEAKDEFSIAAKEYEKALKYRMREPICAWENLACCYLMMQDFRKARKAISQALSIDPESENAQMILKEIKGEERYGIVLYENERVDDAYSWLKIEAAMENPPALATLYLASIESNRNRDITYIDDAINAIGQPMV